MSSVALLVIGDEILSGEIVDQNAPFLISHLRERGLALQRHVAVPDDEGVIRDELARLRALVDVVVVSGGIGPTHDDMTRPAIAGVLGVTLERNADAEARIRGYYGEAVTDAELSMADMPIGSRLANGSKTGAFGFSVQGVFAFPGVPFLFRDLVRGMDDVFGEATMHRAEIRSERREGEIAPILATAQDGQRDVTIGSYPVYENGGWHVRVVLRGEDAACVDRVADVLRAQL